ncbi:MAG: (d)CMP kinase [Proteobacteria bacterium SW_6_67_9]|nr:MAG: (d)CMP kinase [Proteobacteria bacterium SW_6_67_9]
MASEGHAPVICVDGPSGSGKGTIAQRVAAALGFHLLDSGALYRLTALAAARAGVDWDSPDALAQTAARMRPHFEPGEGGAMRITLDGVDVTEAIRGEAVGMNASRVAAEPAVRAALLQRQRDFRQPPGLVADGRDMGTVVFPDAELKLFLTASARERAERRHKQLKEKGIDANLSNLLQDIEARDAHDAQRGASPMAAADDAIVIDSTARSVDSVTDEALERARRVL